MTFIWLVCSTDTMRVIRESIFKLNVIYIFLFSHSNFDTGFIFNKSVQIAVSFTLETDGKLPIGTKLKDAITEIDKATDNGPIYYMINCTHTTHFDHVFGKMQL